MKLQPVKPAGKGRRFSVNVSHDPAVADDVGGEVGPQTGTRIAVRLKIIKHVGGGREGKRCVGANEKMRKISYGGLVNARS